jgi:hypothetical protein
MFAFHGFHSKELTVIAAPVFFYMREEWRKNWRGLQPMLVTAKLTIFLEFSLLRGTFFLAFAI